MPVLFCTKGLSAASPRGLISKIHLDGVYVRVEARTLQSCERQKQVLRLAALAQDDRVSRSSSETSAKKTGPLLVVRSGPDWIDNLSYAVAKLSYAFAEVSAPKSAANFSVEKASIRSPSLMSLKPPRPMPHSMPFVTSRTSSFTRLSELILPLKT